VSYLVTCCLFRSGAAPVAGKDAQPLPKSVSSGGSSSSSGAAAGDANPTAAALSQLLQGLSRLASTLPKSSPAPAK
jgi:hypothetical protein